jgi:outer membrane protein assembly factor BamB
MSRFLLTAVLAFTTVTSFSADNWPHWRGPNFDGSTDAAGLPTDFSKTDNVTWAAALPGPSGATPAVWGDHVFVSSTNPKTQTLMAICIDRKTGDIRWQHEVGKGYKYPYGRSDMASPSPTVDGEGKRVFFFYGNGDLVGYTFSGRKLWTKNLQKEYGNFYMLWTFSSSPTFWEGRLYMQILQRNTPVRDGQDRGDGKEAESYFLAFDPGTGKELFKVSRPDKAKSEAKESFSTPIPFVHNGRKELVISGGDCLTGHDPATGKELWRWGTWNPNRIGHWRLVPSPTTGGGVVVICAPKTGPVMAVKAGLSGTQAQDAALWSIDEKQVKSDVITPLFYQGNFYITKGEGKRTSVSCVSPDGKVLWTEMIPSKTKLRGSTTGADGKLWYMNHHGVVFILNAKDGKLIKAISMGEDGDDTTRSSIVAVGNQLFIRTNSKLFCVTGK